MAKKTRKKTLRDLKPKPVTKASRKARRRLIDSINITPSGKGLIGPIKRRTPRKSIT